MSRGGLVTPIQDAARAVGNSVRKLERHVQFPNKGATLEPLLRPRDGLESVLALGRLRNECVHLFVQEALIVCSLVARPSEGKGKLHWVRSFELEGDVQRLADIFKLQFSYPKTFEEALNSLSRRGAVATLYDDGYGERVQLLTTSQARRLVKLLRGMLVPLIDAYWIAALSFLPLQGEGALALQSQRKEGHELAAAGGVGVLLRSHLSRMQRIANTMYLENKVHSAEAASESWLLKAVAVFELDSLIQRSVQPDRQVLVRVLSASERQARLATLHRRTPSAREDAEVRARTCTNQHNRSEPEAASQRWEDVEGERERGRADGGDGRGGQGEESGDGRGRVGPLFSSLLDAIRFLDAIRRLAPSCGPLLEDSPGIVSVS